MPSDEQINAEAASQEAVHKTKNAQQAIEAAREAQIKQAIAEASLRTKADLLEALKEVFGGSDTEDPNQMRILVRRIPILCTNVLQMHADISDIKDNFKWGTRIVIGAVILGVLKLIFLP
jgi:hypothetical protein